MVVHGRKLGMGAQRLKAKVV